MQKNGIVVLVWGLLFLICMSTGIAHADGEKFGIPKNAAEELLKKVEDSKGKRGISSVQTFSQSGWTFFSTASEEYMGEMIVSTLEIAWYCYPGVCRGDWYFKMSSVHSNGFSEMWQGEVASVSFNDIGEMVVDTGSDIVGEVTITQVGATTRSDKNAFSSMTLGTILKILTTGRDRAETSDFVHAVGDTPEESFRRWKSTGSWIYYDIAVPPGKG